MYYCFNDCSFYTTYRMKFILSDGIKKIDDVIERIEALMVLFKKWKTVGVMYERGAEDDYATFSVKGIDKAVELEFEVQKQAPSVNSRQNTFNQQNNNYNNNQYSNTNQNIPNSNGFYQPQ